MHPRRAPRRRGGRRGTRGRGGGRYVHLEDIGSQERASGGDNVENVENAERAEQEVNQTQAPPITVPRDFARQLAAAFAEVNALRATATTGSSSRALEAMREFQRMNPPKFDGEGDSILAASHWLTDIRMLFDALSIVENDLRAKMVACQLTGEAKEWWLSILSIRRDARWVTRTAAQANEPDVEYVTWVEFEAYFESQYFPATYKEQLRIQFERLEQGNMTVTEYAIKFQSLARFGPELVMLEERKCRRFEMGLHPAIKRLVVGHRLNSFADLLECARSVELPRNPTKEVRPGKQRQGNPGTGSSSGNFGGQEGNKRSRDTFQSGHGQSGPKPSYSGAPGVSFQTECDMP